MRISENHNSLGCKQPSGLDVKQSPNAHVYTCKYTPELEPVVVYVTYSVCVGINQTLPMSTTFCVLCLTLFSSHVDSEASLASEYKYMCGSTR